MKLAHSVVITPRRCGLYETTRELVVALRAAGIDSRMVDPTRERNTLYPNGTEDRGAPFADEAWAESADLIVNHSGLGPRLEKLQTPTIHVAHGRPRSSFLGECAGQTPVYSYLYQLNRDARVKSVVTFWPQHKRYLEVMLPDKPVTVVSAPVDLNAWTPDGPKGYQFGGHRGRVNVVIADAWRDDVDPFVPINAFAIWARTGQRAARLHLYGSDKYGSRGWGALLRRLEDDGTLGERKGWVRGLDHVYRAADLLITPNTINTRAVREAMACGCPVVRVTELNADELTAMSQALSKPRGNVRREAEKLFDPARTAAEFQYLIERKALAA